MKPLKKKYASENELIEEFCRRNKCKECESVYENGSDEGYGCEGMEKFVAENENLIVED